MSLIFTDNFIGMWSGKKGSTSFLWPITSTHILIKSEQTQDLEAALIILTSSIHNPGPITFTTGWASWFLALCKDTDTQPTALKITLYTQDKFNWNFNTVVDLACRELENKIWMLAHEGGSITEVQLTQTTVSQLTLLQEGQAVSLQNIHREGNKHRTKNQAWWFTAPSEVLTPANLCHYYSHTQTLRYCHTHHHTTPNTSHCKCTY